MKAHLILEGHETVPPTVFEQIKLAVARIIQAYGLTPAIYEDRQAELEAYQRYWAWQNQEFPKTPADSEVK